MTVLADARVMPSRMASRSLQSLHARLEPFVAAAFSLVLSGGPIQLWRAANQNWEADYDVAFRQVWYGFLLWLAASVYVRPRLLAPRWRAVAPWLALAGWALLTRFWSVDPGLTTSKAFDLLGSVVFGWYLGSRFSRTVIVRVLAGAMAVGALLSLYWSTQVVLPPEIRLLSVGWQGIYLHSNYLGAAAALGVVVSVGAILVAIQQKHPTWPLEAAAWAAFLSLHVFELHKSSSLTGQVSAATALGAMACGAVLLAVTRGRGRRAFTRAGAVMSGVILTGGAAFVVAGGLGKLAEKGDWRAREGLWRILFPLIKQREMQGYGYFSLWTYNGGFGSVIESRWAKYLPNGASRVHHAHNGYVDTLLGTGLPGFALLFAGLTLTAWAVVIGLRPGPGRLPYGAALWPVGVLAVTVVGSMAESVMLNPPSIHIAALAAISSSAGRPLVGAARRRVPPWWPVGPAVSLRHPVARPRAGGGS